MQQQSRFVIVGLGHVGMQLVSILPREISLVCIDTNDGLQVQLLQLRGDTATFIRGDATSRLVLESAGICKSDTVIISTTNEKVNIEVARLISENFQVQRVISLGISTKGIAELDSYGAEVESIFFASAIGIRNRLELKSKTVHGVGVGKNEILEVEVHPNSRLVGKRLSSLRPIRWHVGIIYRDGAIVVPRGDTVLKARDKVILLGDPQALRTISEIITFRFEEFPLEYGDVLYVFVGKEENSGLIDEVCYVLDLFPLKHAVIIHTPWAAGLANELRARISSRHGITPDIEESPLPPQEAMAHSLKCCPRQPGLVVMAHPGRIGWLYSFIAEGYEKKRLRELCRTSGCPILLTRGSMPFSRVAVPCIDNDSLELSLETALEITTSVPIEIEALLVSISPYIASDREIAETDRMKQAVADLSLVYRKPVGMKELAGNPIRALTEGLASHNLLVVNIGGWRMAGLFNRIFRPDACWHVIRRSPVSTLLVLPTDLSI